MSGEYTWVATGPIMHGSVRAYNRGDGIPADNVKAHQYDLDGLAVPLAVWVEQAQAGDPIPAGDPSAPTERGQMPSGLRGGPEADKVPAKGRKAVNGPESTA